MSRPKTADREALVRLLVDEIVPQLFLQAYEIAVVIEDVPRADDDSDEEAAAVVLSNYPYLNATITAYPSFFNQSEALQRHVVRHELSHIITQPMKAACHQLVSGALVTWQEIKDRNETLTDWIARIAARGATT